MFKGVHLVHVYFKKVAQWNAKIHSVFCVNSPYTLRRMARSPTNLEVTATCQVINSAVQLL